MENDETNAEPVARRQACSHMREMQVVESDRVAMLGAANTFVHLITTKQASVISPTLDAGEAATYAAALGYLRRQFDLGHREAEIYDLKMEYKEVVE